MQASHIIHGHDCPFRLCEHEKADVRAGALELHATNPAIPVESAAKLLGAYLLLKKVMGPEWARLHLTPEVERPMYAFFRQSFRSDEEKYEWAERLMCLANLFYKLVGVKGLNGRLDELARKSIEEVVFELRMADRLIDSGHHVHFVDPKNTKGTDYDLDVWVKKQRIAVEVKCKSDDTEFSHGTMRSTFTRGRSQLPKDLPCAIMVKLPRPWLLDERILEEIPKAVYGFLWNTGRVNTVVTYFERVTPETPTERGRHETLFGLYQNPSPRVPVEGLEALLRPGDGVPCDVEPLYL